MVLKAYEHFLRLDECRNVGDLIRARAVYWIGWSVVVSQLINLFVMTWTYGEWTLDHLISTLAILALITLIHCLRFTKNYTIFAFSYSVMLLAGVGGPLFRMPRVLTQHFYPCFWPVLS